MEEFTKALVQLLQERVGTKVTIDVKEVTKVNDQKLHTINIMEPEDRISRNYYIEAYYEQYRAGMSIEMIAENILKYASEKDVVMEKTGLAMVKALYDYEAIENRLMVKMISKERNSSYLQDKVYMDYLDLACVFCIEIEQPDNGLATIAVPQAVYEEWGVSKEELYEKALSNMEKRFPVLEQDIMEIVGEIYKKYEDDEFSEFMNPPVMPEVSGMYVVSNADRLNGASVILYKDMLKNFAEKHEVKKLYILPSSLHEVIIIPDDGSLCKDTEMLNEMVVSVNCTQVQADDILSDHIYVYEYLSDTVTY